MGIKIDSNNNKINQYEIDNSIQLDRVNMETLTVKSNFVTDTIEQNSSIAYCPNVTIEIDGMQPANVFDNTLVLPDINTLSPCEATITQYDYSNKWICSGLEFDYIYIIHMKFVNDDDNKQAAVGIFYYDANIDRNLPGEKDENIMSFFPIPTIISQDPEYDRTRAHQICVGRLPEARGLTTLDPILQFSKEDGNGPYSFYLWLTEQAGEHHAGAGSSQARPTTKPTIYKVPMKITINGWNNTF